MSRNNKMEVIRLTLPTKTISDLAIDPNKKNANFEACFHLQIYPCILLAYNLQEYTTFAKRTAALLHRNIAS
ncbi:hypothetical protein MA16_Dca019657 [Dendrobium catenatum]|uniref:Uncharacterized protein n=1 Tax=Dendrobium catenatum TaxID=906689 RepID=A0A2I0WNK3_9ASPA|nr:hypothetical protein MA16_Dca019657 [Dendrobium catenatum]